MFNEERQRKLPSYYGYRFLICFLLITLFIGAIAESEYSHAVVESCRGCQLNRLPEVKSFIFEDVPQYDNVEFKHIQGAPPELVLYPKSAEGEKRIALSSLTRNELNALLVSYGFKKSKSDL